MARTGPLLLLAALLLTACAARQDQAAPPLAEDAQSLPRTLAVLPVAFEPEGEPGKITLENGYSPLVRQLSRAYLFNALAGKGYLMIPSNTVDDMVAATAPDGDWRAADMTELARDLGADGLVRLTLTDVRAADSIVYEEYLVQGRMDLVDADGRVLGPWEETATARDLSIPTGPISAAALLFETAVDEPAEQKVRNLAFSWGALLADHVTPSPHAPDLPAIKMVEANVQQGVFGRGQLVAVRMAAEPGLKATFSLGDYRTNLPLDPMEPGDYIGLYQVGGDDQAKDLPLVIHMVKNGVERVWVEESRLTLDGAAPRTPSDLKAEPTKNGVQLSWTPPPEDDLALFVIQRSDKAAGDYATVGTSRDAGWLDEDVLQESTYHYRVLAEDEAGNLSHASRSVKTVTPRLTPAPLPPVATGTLSPGPYLVPDVTVVPKGERLRVPAGAELVFDPGSALLVDGDLILAGREDLPVVLSGREWHGVVISPGGSLVASQARLQGCEFCLLAEDAEVAMDRVSLSGGTGTGVEIIDCMDFALEGLEVRDFSNGLVLSDSRGHLTESSIRGNAIGLTVTGGEAEVTRNDISGNGVDVASDGPLVLRENYLGSTDPAGLRLEGPVEVKSLLTDKPPYGKVVDLDLSHEERAALFEKYRNAGAAAFAEGRYGDAHEDLAKALYLFPDRGVYLLLAYTRQAMGEDPLPTLLQALNDHPRDVRIHQALARELAGQGQVQAALDVVRQGLAFQPGHPGLAELESILERELAVPKRNASAAHESEEEAPPTSPDLSPDLSEEEYLERELLEPDP